MINNERLDRLFELGKQNAEHGQLDTAACCFNAICAVSPGYTNAWRELALAQMILGKYRQALNAIRRALAINQESSRTLSVAAMVYANLGYFDHALTYIREAKSKEPGSSGLDLIEAEILCLSGDFIRSEQLLLEAAIKGADFCDVEIQRCELLRVKNDLEQQEYTLNNLIAINPNFSRAHLMLGEIQLAQQLFNEGWTNYEYRLRIPNHPILRNYPWPYWNGENLQNKTLLVYGEQGIGDEILFASCLLDLLEVTQRIILVCEEQLAPLLANSFPKLEILTFTEVPQFAELHSQSVDHCVAIGSLPLHFRQSASDFPIHNGYLQTADEWIQPWREKLQTLGNGLKVGIAWQGGLMRTGQLTRSLQPEQLLPLLELPGIQFVNIQHGKVRRELEWLAEKRNLPVSTWPLDTKNMSELAGLVSALDLIITPCCSLVHLAGALGKPVWVMTPKVAAWRYLNEGETMPWYPSARLFRQPESGDWASVIESIRQQLIQKTGV